MLVLPYIVWGIMDRYPACPCSAARPADASQTPMPGLNKPAQRGNKYAVCLRQVANSCLSQPNEQDMSHRETAGSNWS